MLAKTEMEDLQNQLEQMTKSKVSSWKLYWNNNWYFTILLCNSEETFHSTMAWRVTLGGAYDGGGAFPEAYSSAGVTWFVASNPTDPNRPTILNPKPYLSVF